MPRHKNPPILPTESPFKAPLADMFDPVPVAWMTPDFGMATTLIISAKIKNAAPDRYAQYTVPLYRKLLT